jgi:hypothetical protein
VPQPVAALANDPASARLAGAKALAGEHTGKARLADHRGCR